MATSALQGIWKISATLRSGVTTALPRRIRFTEGSSSPAAALQSGTVQVPYADHCSGHWEVLVADDADAAGSGAMQASFSVRCAAGSGAAEAEHLNFMGLFDGERIAGKVHTGNHEIGDFLCTRLFTFWGSPNPKATGEGGPTSCGGD